MMRIPKKYLAKLPLLKGTIKEGVTLITGAKKRYLITLTNKHLIIRDFARGDSYDHVLNFDPTDVRSIISGVMSYE